MKSIFLSISYRQNNATQNSLLFSHVISLLLNFDILRIMISFKLFILYVAGGFLAFSFTYFTPLLQDKLWQNNVFQSDSGQDITTPSQQGGVEDSETVAVEIVNGVKSDANAAMKTADREDEQGTKQPSEFKTENGGEKHKDPTRSSPDVFDKSDGLPVYPEYSEMSVYMLSMLVSEEEEEKRSSGMTV